jgi:hypothetical protein
VATLKREAIAAKRSPAEDPGVDTMPDLERHR